MSFDNSLDDVTLLCCDRPGCDAALEGVGHSKHARQRDASDLAYRKGWQLSPHGFTTTDLCPMHLEPTLPHRLPVTRLYDEGGRELDYRGKR